MKLMKVTKYLVDDDEMETIKRCLVYCLHRLRKHPESGIKHSTNKSKVEKLINQLD